ncbi:MAG: PEP-CTERM sorting domain-containing protein [Phycisphaeraceae bacterium]
MFKTKTMLFAATAAGMTFSGMAQGSALNFELFQLVTDNGLAGVPIRFDFNDLSISTSLNGGAPAVSGDVIQGVFTIETVTLTAAGGTFIDQVNLADTDVEVFGRFELVIDTLSPTLITTSSAVFEIFEDDRTDGVRTVAGLTGSTAYASSVWGGGGISNGTAYGLLNTASGGSYDLFQLPNGDLSILPNLDIAPAGLPLNDPALGAGSNVLGTGTVTPTSVAGEFNNRASFNFGAVVPEPASAALMGLAGIAMLRRR